MTSDEPLLDVQVARDPQHVRSRDFWCSQSTLEPAECPACGWTDLHPREPLGYRCVWCRHLFTEEA